MEVEDANGLTEEDRALEEFMGSLKRWRCSSQQR